MKTVATTITAATGTATVTTTTSTTATITTTKTWKQQQQQQQSELPFPLEIWAQNLADVNKSKSNVSLKRLMMVPSASPSAISKADVTLFKSPDEGKSPEGHDHVKS